MGELMRLECYFCFGAEREREREDLCIEKVKKRKIRKRFWVWFKR